MGPELPYLAAGGVAVIGSTIREGHLPELTRPLLGVVALVIVASATSETRFAPLVRAFGFLVLLVAVMAATNAVVAKGKKSSPITVGIHKNTPKEKK